MSPYFSRLARMDCVIAFPPERGFNGAMTTIQDLSQHGLFRGNLGVTGTKREAVSLLVSRNLETPTTGKGNASERRLSTIRQSSYEQ